jgi:hypothetical protein
VTFKAKWKVHFDGFIDSIVRPTPKVTHREKNPTSNFHYYANNLQESLRVGCDEVLEERFGELCT